MMHLTYHLDADDIVAFNQYLQQTRPALRRQQRLNQLPLLVVSLAILVLGAVLDLVLQVRITFLTIGIGGLLAYAYVVIWIDRWVISQTLARIRDGVYAATFALQQVVLTPDAFQVTINEVTTQRPWSTFEQVVVTDHALYLFFSAYCAQIVPRRAIDQSTAWDTLIHLAHHYHTAARS